ncbi:hypothetical protein BDA96_05G163100 [Sorghum bicolor]|uniref:Tubulin alpha chain n=2 Tax=Sorghum bicolor TaxID=4558 RepID=A0A921QZ54_SORBI|nr:uncharacterized protein LOC8058591 [Sorghum bicolor]KAG0530179.1 hypothetical protein BDA96_05G163100 [Sorghum bicolor]KXG28661.1 hypothetical protein SORBI_3005G149700 [Sorghum bicolor]|eukprot:XP_002450936.2 uncharacterized protein LOC8058591 [Sorghum bicolor]
MSSPAMAMAVIRLARPAAIRPPSAPSLRPTARLLRRLRVVRCRAGGGGNGEGGKGKEEGEAAEAPESLFARELRRRGMAPGAAAAGANKEAEEGAPPEAGAKRRVAAAEFERAAAADGQRQRSMALNSEGLEGLVPRAKLLLSLGGTFFLAFGPLILVTVSLFAGLYVYFGPSFVHDASKTPVSVPPYIDPYELLEDERLSRPSPDVF